MLVWQSNLVLWKSRKCWRQCYKTLPQKAVSKTFKINFLFTSAIAHNWSFFTKLKQTFWSIYRVPFHLKTQKHPLFSIFSFQKNLESKYGMRKYFVILEKIGNTFGKIAISYHTDHQVLHTFCTSYTHCLGQVCNACKLFCRGFNIRKCP